MQTLPSNISYEINKFLSYISIQNESMYNRLTAKPNATIFWHQWNN